MNKFILYCKSYRNDFDRLVKLNESINKHNVDNIPFYVSVPDEDLVEANRILPDVTIVSDKDIAGEVPSNWFTQQLVKSSAWKLLECDNYLCLDSDSFFIRDFTVSDFMYDEDTPYTVCHEGRDLWNWSTGKEQLLGFDPKISFTKDRQKIMDVFGRSGVILDFGGPSPNIWSRKVWSWLDDMLLENDMTFGDALKIVPSELTWYGEAFLYSQVVRLIPREPLFKVFHYYAQYQEYKDNNVSIEHIAKNYMGIVLQSNWELTGGSLPTVIGKIRY